MPRARLSVLSPAGISGAGTRVPRRQLIGTAGQTEPLSAAPRDLPASEPAVNTTEKETNSGSREISGVTQGAETRADGQAQKKRLEGRGYRPQPQSRLEPATLEVQAGPRSPAAVETAEKLLGLQ